MGWYKKMVLMGAGMATAGTLWHAGRAWLGPMGIDYGEAAGAVLERGWVSLPENGMTEAGLRAGMTNWMRSAMRPQWGWVSNTLGNGTCALWNLEQWNGVGNEGGLMWYRGLDATQMLAAAQWYTRGAGGKVTPQGWAPVHAGAGDWAALDASSASNAAEYGAVTPLDAGDYGTEDGKGGLAGFAWQARKWRGLETNDLNAMRAALTNLTRIAYAGAVPTNGARRVTRYAFYESGVIPGGGDLDAMGAAAWGALSLTGETWSTNGMDRATGWEGVHALGTASAYKDAVNGTNSWAELRVWVNTYSGIGFEWPARFCLETGLVTSAHIATAARLVDGDPFVDAAGSDDPADWYWQAGNEGLVATPELRTAGTSETGGFRTHDLEISANALKEVGTDAGPVSLDFVWSMPSFSALVMTDDGTSEAEGVDDEWRQWDLQRDSGFFFVVLPETAMEYMGE